MPAFSPKAVLFDNDGTLVDTYDLILASHRYATREVLGRVIPDEVLMAKVGIPLETQMADYTDDPDTLTELCAVYRDHNATVHDELIGSFAGITEMLDALHAQGIRLGIVTSKRQEVCRKGLRVFDLEEYFECVVGGADCATHKPDAGPILMACDLLGLDPRDCAYVGDSPFDIQAGNAAGCFSVAVLWGMFSEERLRAENPDAVASTPHELVDLLS